MKPAQFTPMLAVLLTMGCIHTEETITKDDPRTPIEFENETAGRVFYEALSRHGNSGAREESSTDVSLPFVFEHRVKTVRDPNEAFNRAVSQCDTNHDGKITEVEARIYADRRRS